MKKIAVFLLVTLLFSLVTVPAGAQEEITVLVDGKPVVFDVAPIMKNDRVLIPLRAVGEALGAYVEWNEESQSIYIGRRGVLQQLTLNQPTATAISDFNQKEAVLDVAPFTVNDRTLVPLRYIAEGFNAQVDWDNDTNTVIIQSHNPVVMTVNGAEITEGIYNFFLFSDDTNSHLLSTFAFNKLAQEKGLTATEEDIWATAGSKEEYDIMRQTMLKFGMTESEYEFFTRSMAYANLVYDHIINTATEDEMKDFYESEFVTAKHILLITEDQDKETVKKQAEDLLARIKKGEDFDKLMMEYSQDPGLAEYPEGYTFSYGEMVEEFEDAAYALEVGQVSELVETDYGYHIIKRMPLEKLTDLNEFIETYAFAHMQSIMDQAVVTKNQELIDGINLELRTKIFDTIAQTIE